MVLTEGSEKFYGIQIPLNARPINVNPNFLGYVKHSNLLMLVVEDEFELIHCGNMSSVINRRNGISKPLNTTTANSTAPAVNLTTPKLATTALAELPSPDATSKKKNKPIDYSLVRFEDFNVDLILGNYNFDSNMSNASNFTDYPLIVDRKPDFNINRYRRRPSHCHSIFVDEKEYLPCSLAVRTHLKHAAVTQLLAILSSLLANMMSI